MAHEHIIVDTDVSFVIDPITRAITTESSKLYLTQYDHNSEKYTFKIPRIIEGHDISDCDTIMIDFDNANRRKTLVNSGSYKVKEIVAEEDNVLFTWTVSRESTQIAGSLSFSVSFRCYDDDGNIIYEFGTDKFNKITILEKSRYDQTTVTNYPDLIEQIKEDILDVAVTSVNGETPDENGDVSITIPEGFSGSWNDLSDKPAITKSVNGNTPDKNGNVQIDTASSWNDLTDKPFYEGDELVVISECEVTSITTNEGWRNLTDGNGNYAYPTNCDLPLATYVYGDDYVIDINGETYNLKLSQSYDGSLAGVYYLGFNVTGGNNANANLASGAKFAIFTQLGRANDFVDGETFEGPLYCYLSSDIALPATIKIKHREKVLNQLDHKYIKDMYYEEGNITDIAGMEITLETAWSLDEVEHGMNIPFALGQVWKITNTSYADTELPVQEAEDGTLYIGTYPDVNDVPFYVTANTLKGNSGWIRTTNPDYGIFTCVSGTIVGDPIVHHLDPKYIKDMYHEEPVELFSVENAEFVDNGYMLETPFAIVDGHTYIVNWDGVEYTCEAYIFEGITSIGNTAEFGDKGNGEPFVIGYDSLANVSFVNSFDDLTTHTFSVTEMVRHTIPPKYIKDMYYDNTRVVEVNETCNIGGAFCPGNVTLGNLLKSGHDLSNIVITIDGSICTLEFEEPYYKVTGVPESALSSGSCYFQFNSDGGVYLLNSAPDFNVTTIATFTGYYEIADLKQIDTKYLPILEEAQETIFESDDFVVFREYIGPEYGKLLGKYIVSIDGISETVEFIESDEYSSFVETDYYMIHSSNDPDSAEYNKIFMGLRVPDDIVHSVKLARIKDVIKAEYLPDSVTAKPDWNQSDEASSDYVKNRTHYDDITHYLIDGAFVNLDINQLYTVQIYDDIYENVPVYNAGSNNDPRWGVGDMRVVNYPFGFFKYPCWPSNDIINTELSMISFDRNIYPDATINDVQIYQRILKKLDEKYIPDTIARAEDVDALHALVGDTPVAEQVNNALNESAVLYSAAQELTDEQKQQAQDNIGFSETDAIELATNMGLISPVAAEDGSIYTDENGALYSL